jgi:signal transduction histidine kinase
LKSIGRLFGDLKVRPKLMVLHNLLFLVIAGVVYVALVPLLRRHVTDESVLLEARWILLAVLGGVYVLAVALLEFVILPRHVYRPIRLMLEADAATRRGDREHELVEEGLIPGDEIGQIMRSRNATVTELRRQEDELEGALARLEEAAENLERKHHQLETAKKTLADQDRLVSIGLMSAGVAHELNTPLAVIRGSVEKLLETAPDDATCERLGRTMRAVRRLEQISESLLDFAKAQDQTLQPVSLPSVVEEAWSLVKIHGKSKSVRFFNGLQENDVVIGNADRLVQVFVNLLRNALNAIQSNGDVTVVSTRVTNEGRNWVRVSVEDDGMGIPADVLPNIFEAFVTSRLDSHGIGLGLTVAEGIVYEHGGTITAANRPAGGARLEVTLPAAG